MAAWSIEEWNKGKSIASLILKLPKGRILQEQGPEMQHYKGPDVSSSLNEGVYHPHSNGHSEHSPNSSHMSVHSDEPLVRTQKQQTTQQVTTVTKVVREVQQLGDQAGGVHSSSFGILPAPFSTMITTQTPTGPIWGTPLEPSGPPTPPSPSEHSGNPSPLPMASQPNAPYLGPGYDELPEHYRVTPSPGGPIGIDPYQDESAVVYGYVSPSPYGTAAGLARPFVDSINGPVPVGATMRMFEDEDLQKHISKMSLYGHNVGLPHERVHNISSPGSIGGDDDQRGMRWRDPNLTEVIGFLNNPNNVIKANAAAYLQHLCYMDDPNKQKTRALGGIPPLVKLLSHDSIEVYRNACGALRNLSYGRQNDENKRAIKNAGGIPALINLLRRSNEAEIKELVTGVIWNMSSCEDLKRNIIDDGVQMVVTYIIIPHSGWDPQGNHGETCWSTVFRNASGVLRNVSSAGEYARKKLRECEGLVDALLFVVRCAIDKSNIGNKIVENCVCILRNLSYRCQEVDDPNYDKNPVPTQSRVAANSKGENLGCFGGSKKKKDSQSAESKDNNFATGSSGAASSAIARGEPVRGMELLWQPEVVQSYLALLQSCSNPETLEAAAGALQNLAACYWQPSIEIRAAVRKEKGLPILVELLRMEVDRVVCAVATALRNLAIDQRNKELIGKYAMRDLVQKLPSGNPQHDQGTSDDTIAAVLATLNEVIKKNAEFSRSLLEAGGVERLMTITRQRQKYTPRVLKFAGQVLFTMWQHQDLRDVYKKHGWKEQDFVTKTVAARNAGPNSPNNANSTLNRPMASQSGTRYEDRTMKRTAPGARGVTSAFQRNDDIPMADMAYPDTQPVIGRAYPPGQGPNPPPVSH
ncbi:hypothetical protein NQ317_012007 [Molorchus minor]|uniref:Catenin delta-2 n=1 Tax=Molorchus minor TaxID=1323400 RepID=A0ABQ9K090_9CUCU|nr:hypothetical protein NQ317_012007 [Molorchus minor]